MIAFGGLVMVLSALLGAGTGDARPTLMTLAMFLLGVGWNFGFVAASAVLQENLALRDGLRLQGIADSVTWASGGVAALASGFIMAAWSFQALALLGAGLALIPWIALWRDFTRS